MSAVPATDAAAHRLAELLARTPSPLRQLADDVPFDISVELHTFLREAFGPGSYGLHECWDAAARAVLERPVTPERTALLRSLLLGNSSGFRGWELIRLVQGLYDAGALDDDVLHPLLRVRHRSWELCPVDPARREQPHFHDRPALWDEASAGCRDRIADSLDRFVDLLSAAPTAESVEQLRPGARAARGSSCRRWSCGGPRPPRRAGTAPAAPPPCTWRRPASPRPNRSR